ncbi:MAG: DoxX family protein [Acidobacteriota bacterium]|nr:DoxX family protein [Acidobacteriota bacterium]
MERFLGRYEPYFYALLRIISGFLFLLHGTQKFFNFPPMPKGMQSGPLNALMTVGATIEVVAGLLILIGLFTSIAAFIASGMMAAAYFMAHQPQGALPTSNGGDAAVMFCFVFLYMAARGSGVLSVDAARRGDTGATAMGART